MHTLSFESNFLAIDFEYSNYTDSKIIIVPSGYEHTVSYGKGASLGPEEIIKASAFVEFYDDEFDRELCFDLGIATLEPLIFNKLYDNEALLFLQNVVNRCLNDGKFVVTLGGEHTISIAPISIYFKYFPDMSLLHFDAHSDLRNEYEGTKYSHACFMSRVCEFFPPDKISQVGIRAQCIEESKFIKNNKIKTYYASAIRRGLFGDNWQRTVAEKLGDLIYVTFDVDYFDPSIIPSTGTPEPDGFLYNETLNVFREINSLGKRIIGFDVVELAPLEGLHHPNLTTARLVYKMLNFAFAKDNF